MKTPKDYLGYCIKYQDSFPDDFKTAINFIELAWAEKAKNQAETQSDFDAIAKCLIAAISIIGENHEHIWRINSRIKIWWIC